MKLGLIGAGNMASALARGMGRPVLVSDPDEARAQALAAALDGEALASNAEVAERADVVVLCHKPKQLDEVASELRGLPKAVASILGAVTTALLGRAGTVIPLADEALIEPAMAVMSSGVAFVALVAEAFADAGAAHGLERADAVRMAVGTMDGTAAWAAEHDFDLAGLRERVATPGGVTERGLDALEERGLRDVCRAAVDAVVEATR